MSSEITILKQMTDASFKQKVLMKLFNSHGIILLRDKYERHMPLKVKHMENLSVVTCDAATQTNLDFSYSETFTAHFIIDNEKYMFETTPTMEGNSIVLPIKRVFHLQKRQTMRYRVPPSAEIKLVIGSLNQQSCLIDCIVSDINSLGCSVIVTSHKTQLQLNDLIDATLISSSDAIQVQGVIKNVRPHGPEQWAVGIEIHHMLYAGDDRLTSLIAELHSKTHLKSS